MNVAPRATFEAVIETGQTGLASTIGVEINDNTGVNSVPFVGGAIELAPGVYSLPSLTAPGVAGSYTIIWRNGNGGPVLGIEDLSVSSTAVPTPSPVYGGGGLSGSALITEFLADKRFGTSRTRVLGFLNYRYGELLMLEEWAFLQGEQVLTLGAPIVVAPVDMGVPTSLYLGDDGTQLAHLTLDAFYNAFAGSSDTGRPAAFAVRGNSLLIGPSPDSAYSATLLYQLQAAALADDTTTPILPGETHLALVAGAQAFALELENDPTGGPLEARYQKTIDAMRRRYLVAGRGIEQQMPRDPVLR